MTRQMAKIQQAAALLLDAGFEHIEVARLFGITEAKVRDLCLHRNEDEDSQSPAKGGKTKVRLRQQLSNADDRCQPYVDF